jgi:hypothetical protein
MYSTCRTADRHDLDTLTAPLFSRECVQVLAATSKSEPMYCIAVLLIAGPHLMMGESDCATPCPHIIILLGGQLQSCYLTQQLS